MIRPRHAEGCREERCAAGCPLAEFRAWLDGPITRTEIEQEQRREENLQRLLRGEIPT